MPKSGAGQLFVGLKFWVSRQIPDRKEFIKRLQHHGGLLLDKETEDSYNLINPEKHKSTTASTCYDYKFVLDSLDQGTLLNDDQYEIRSLHPANRITGSGSALQKGTRTKFTPEDDQLLFNWVEPLRLDGGSVRGNEIYRQLAQEHPHHTFQSWRDRYLKYVAIRTDMSVTARVHPGDGSDADNLARPTKRRRVNENEPDEIDRKNADIARAVESIEEQPDRRLAHSTPPSNGLRRRKEDFGQRRSVSDDLPEAGLEDDREGGKPKNDSPICTPDHNVPPHTLPRERYLQTSIGGQGFSYEEADHLYKAVPAICNTSPEKLKTGWKELASHTDWNRHSIKEWQAYYEYHIFPEFKRANGIETQEELDAHIADIEAQKYISSSSEENGERSSDYAPEDTDSRPQDEVQGLLKHFLAPDAHTTLDEAGLADLAIAENGNQALSGSNSKSSATQRAEATANEGRKRVSQQLDANSAHSPPAAAATTPMSQKKKLFGRVFELSGALSQSQPSLVAQSEISSVQINVTSSVLVPSNICSTNKTNASSSCLSLPTALNPPQSFQIPPNSISTSQESANYETALQAQGNSVEVPEEPVLPDHIINLTGNDKTDLLDGERTESEPDSAGHPLSDTGSEYMAFETEVERNQMWETGSQFDGEMTDLSDEEGPQNEPKINIKPATPLKRHATPKKYSPTEWTEKSDAEEEEDAVHGIGATSHVVPQDHARIETQALFQKPTQQAPSLFDLPDPDGGWESLGVIQDPDEAIDTIELSDGYPQKQRQLLSVNTSLAESDSAQTSLVATIQDHNLTVAPSNAAEDASLSLGLGKNSSVYVKEEGGGGRQKQSYDARRSVARTSISARRHSLSSGANRDTSAISASRFGHDGTLAAWMAKEQTKYPELPEMVFKRLASTASQAINLSSITTATLLLQKLVDSFLAYEYRRQADYRRRNPGTGKRLKALTKLSAAQAKELLPVDIRGVWTPEDDDRLTRSSRDSIMMNETKHGVSGVKERINFLKSRYLLKEGGTPVKGGSAISDASSSKRKR